MKIVKQSPYDPSPLFLAANPRFINKVSTRLYFMRGLGKLMDSSERELAAKRVIVECMEGTNPPANPLDLLAKMMYLGNNK